MSHNIQSTQAVSTVLLTNNNTAQDKDTLAKNVLDDAMVQLALSAAKLNAVADTKSQLLLQNAADTREITKKETSIHHRALTYQEWHNYITVIDGDHPENSFTREMGIASAEQIASTLQTLEQENGIVDTCQQYYEGQISVNQQDAKSLDSSLNATMADANQAENASTHILDAVNTLTSRILHKLNG